MEAYYFLPFFVLFKDTFTFLVTVMQSLKTKNISSVSQPHLGRKYFYLICTNTFHLQLNRFTMKDIYHRATSHSYFEGRQDIFYLKTHSTHFIYGYMASDIW